MLDFNANESYRLSICVDKSVFSTIETAQCDVQFYLVNSLLSKCLGTFTLGPPIKSRAHQGSALLSAPSTAGTSLASAQLGGGVPQDFLGRNPVPFGHPSAAAMLSDNYRRALTEHHLLRASRGRNRPRANSHSQRRVIPLKRRKQMVTTTDMGSGITQVQPNVASSEAGGRFSDGNVSIATASSAPVTPVKRTSSGVAIEISRNPSGPSSASAQFHNAASSSSQQRSSHTEINLISDDEDDFEIQEIGAGNVASERDKNSLDSSAMVTHARGSANSSRDPTGTPGTTLPTSVSTRNETSVPLIDNQSAGRVVKLPSSGDELCLPRDFSTASQNSTRVVEEIVSQHPPTSAALKSEADQGLQIPEEVLNATQIVDSNRHEPSLSNSNTFVSNMRNPLYIWSDSLSQEPEQLEDDRSGGVMRTTERTASEQGSPTSGGGSGHHTSPTVVGIKSVSRVAENQQNMESFPESSARTQVVTLESSGSTRSSPAAIELASNITSSSNSSNNTSNSQSVAGTSNSTSQSASREIVRCELCEYQTPSLKRLRLHYATVHLLE